MYWLAWTEADRVGLEQTSRSKLMAPNCIFLQELAPRTHDNFFAVHGHVLLEQDQRSIAPNLVSVIPSVNQSILR